MSRRHKKAPTEGDREHKKQMNRNFFEVNTSTTAKQPGDEIGFFVPVNSPSDIPSNSMRLYIPEEGRLNSNQLLQVQMASMNLRLAQLEAKDKQQDREIQQQGRQIRSLEAENAQIKLQLLLNLLVQWIRAIEPGMLRTKLPFDYFRLGVDMRIDSVSNKIKSLRKLVTFYGDEDVQLFSGIFDNNVFSDIVSARNIQTHPPTLSMPELLKMHERIRAEDLDTQELALFQKCTIVVDILKRLKGIDDYLAKLNKNLQ